MSRLVTFFAVFILLAIGACSPVLESTPDPTLITDDDRRCDVDDDCVLAPSSLCTCRGYGSNTAVARDRVDDIHARAALVDGAPCPSAYGTSPTCCASEAACVDHRCEVIDTGSTSGEACADPEIANWR